MVDIKTPQVAKMPLRPATFSYQIYETYDRLIVFLAWRCEALAPTLD